MMEEQDERMTIEDAELDAAWSEEDGEASDGCADSSSAEEPEENAEQPDREQQEEERPADQPETFTLKHLDETKRVGREEVVALAQKGLDYDRIRTERDRLRQLRQETDPAIGMVKAYAEKNGMDLGQYVEYCRKQELMAQGASEQSASAQAEREQQQAFMAAQTGAAQEDQRRAEARKRDMEVFLDTYPDVRADGIPREVWERVAKGQSLVSAYTMHKNQALEAALAAERQNRQNQLRTTGSLTSPADGDRKDDIDRWWNEED